MAEVTAAEMEQKAEAAFVNTPPLEPAKAVEEVKATPVAETPVVVPPVPVPEKPKYARVLQSDYDNLKAAAGKVSSLESQVARLAGTVGNTEQLERRIVEKVKALTPAGMNVDLSDEDFAELAADFPELAKHTRVTLEKVFKKAGVRGTGEQGPDVEKIVEDILTKREAKREAEDFLTTYPEWEKIVGKVDMAKGETPDPNHPFRAWVAQQPADFQKMVNTTTSPRELKGAIDQYLAGQKAPTTQATPDRAAARRAVIGGAVTPRTDGSPPMINRPMTAEEAFLSVQRPRPH